MQRLTSVLNKLAIIIIVPKGSKHRLVRVVILLPNQGLEVLGGFRTVIYAGSLVTRQEIEPRNVRTKRHLREEVMDNVKVGNPVQEEVANRAKEVTVHRGGSTTGERPHSAAIVWQLGVSMM